MTLGLIAFIVLAATTFFSNGVQAYIHYEAYPLLASVGKPEFAAYLKEYETRLTIPLVVPYVLTLLSNLVLIFTHQAILSVIVIVAAFVLNLAVSIITVTQATPVYNRIKQAGTAAPAELEQLIRINLLRLILSTAASVVVIYMMLNLVSPV